MSAERLAELLGQMAQSGKLAISYVEGMSKEDFLADTRTQQAVIMNLVIIGETATKILQDHTAFTEAQAAIPWRSMKGMRNRIAHGYFDTDLNVVWETVQTSVPDLVQQLAGIKPA